MIELIGKLSESKANQIAEHLNNLDSNLKTDVSRYAPGRRRYWLHQEWQLKEKRFIPAVEDERLWQFCKAIYPQAICGLVSKAGLIDWHRDDSYAGYRAVTINLGEAIIGYQACYPGYEWCHDRNEDAPKIFYELHHGDVIAFNCKNPHKIKQASADRYGINLWCAKKK